MLNYEKFVAGKKRIFCHIGLRKTIYTLIIVQVLIISIILVFIFRKFSKKVSINFINKDYINQIQTAHLKYFYEPKEDTIETIKRDWLSQKVIYTINKDSLNEPRDYPIEKNSGTYRIVALGDSFTFGENINTNKNWTKILEQNLNALHCKDVARFEVLNLGVQGYDLEYSLERYSKRGEKYHPDLIILLLKDDDLEDINELSIPVVDKYDEEHWEEWKKDPSRLYSQGNEVARKSIFKKMSLSTIIDYQLNKLKTNRNLANENLLIYVPLNLNSKATLSKIIKTKEGHKAWELYYTPNSELYSNYGDKYSFSPYDLHPNLKGHELIAQDLLSHLKMRFSSCK